MADDVKPKSYIIGIVMFVFFILGGVYILNEVRNEDTTFINSNELDDYNKFNQTFNKLDDINDSVRGIQRNIENAQSDFGLFGVLNSLINSAWNTLKLLFESFGFMDSVFDGLGSIFGVPEWVSTLLLLIPIIIIAFAIFRAIFKTEI